MHTLSGRPVPETGSQPVEPAPLRIEAERLDRVREMYVSALPRHLSAIALSAREGDPMAVAASAQALAEASSEAGHAEVAWLCGAIAADGAVTIVNGNDFTWAGVAVAIDGTYKSAPVVDEVVPGATLDLPLSAFSDDQGRRPEPGHRVEHHEGE